MEDDILNRDEIEAIMGSLLEGMQDHMGTSVRNNASQMVEFLNQYFLQAEGQRASLHVDCHTLDDGNLLATVQGMLTKSKQPQKTPTKAIDTSFDRDANVVSEIKRFEEENKSIQFRFAKLQEQMKKTVAANREMTQSNNAAEVKLANLRSDIKNLSSQDTAAQEAELKKLQAEVTDKKKALQKVQKDMDGRLRNSTQMKLLKSQLQAKNASIQQLRKQLKG